MPEKEGKAGQRSLEGGGPCLPNYSLTEKNQNTLEECISVSKDAKFFFSILRGLLQDNILRFHLKQIESEHSAPFP